MRTALLVVLVFASPAAASAQDLVPAAPASVGMSAERLARLAEVLRRDVEADRMPGAVVAVARRGRLVYYEAIGFLDKGAGTPMPKDAIFPMASMTKVLAAAGALRLVERAQLLLNDPIGNYLPQLREMKVAASGGSTERARRQPTLQDLMSHSAGFTYGGQGGTELHKRYPASSNAAAAQMTPAQFLDTLGGLPLHYQPGTRWEYSFGLDIVGLAIEAVTKTRLGDALQRELFTPLGMVDTHFAVPPSKAARVAKALPRDPITGEPQASRDVTQQLQFDCGGGCASGTALDYLRFAQMLLNKGTLDGTRVLGRKTVEHMTADHLASGVDLSVLHSFPVENVNGYGFGLGVAVRRHQGTAGVFGSPGDFHWSGAQGTTFWVDPQEQLAVVFMANTPGPIRRHYRQVIKTLVLQAIVD